MSRSISSHVSREKYELLKQKGTQWYEKYEDLVSLNKELTKQLEIATNRLEDMSSQLEDVNTQLEDANTQLEDANTQLEDANTHAPDSDLVDELELDNKSLRKENRMLRKENKVIEDKHRERFNKLERDLFVKDGKIQRLEDSKKDLKERYLELKEDWREERRSNSGYRKETK